MGIMDLLWDPDTGKRARRILIYGEPGIGKTTLAMEYPGSCLIPLDDGFQDVSDIRGRVLPICRTLDAVREKLMMLGNEEHPFAAVVIDRVCAIDNLLCQKVAEEHGKPTVGDIGYGKGEDLVLAKWNRVLDSLEDLSLKRNMAVIFVAHTHVVKKKDPLTDPYDQNQPNLCAKGTNAVVGWCDETFFLTTKIWTMEKDAGFGTTRTKATGGEARVLYTEARPAYMAKNRLGLPHEIPLGTREKPTAWATIKQYMPKPPAIKGPSGLAQSTVETREPGDEATFP